MLEPARLDGVALDHAWIAARIPHQGSMCLLEAVLRWDANHIVCRATSHRTLTNPLRQFGRLGAACGIEYAAQAVAVHGALRAATESPQLPRHGGLLVSVRAAQLLVARLDDIAADLEIGAERVSGDDQLLVYHCRVLAEGRLLAEGRASVVLDAERLGAPFPHSTNP